MGGDGGVDRSRGSVTGAIIEVSGSDQSNSPLLPGELRHEEGGWLGVFDLARVRFLGDVGAEPLEAAA